MPNSIIFTTFILIILTSINQLTNCSVLKPKTVALTLANINGQNYDYYANVTIGTPPQVFKMKFRTGSADSWVHTTDCAFHKDPSVTVEHNLFDSTKSKTFKLEAGKNTTFVYGFGNNSAFVFKDKLCLNGKCINQKIYGLTCDVVDDVFKMLAGAYPVPSYFDGVIGLGPSDNLFDSLIEKESVLGNLILNGYVQEPIIGLMHNRNQSQEYPGGRITFGGIDKNLIDGEVRYVPRISPNWTIHMDNVETTNGTKLGCANGCDLILDTGTITIQGPDSEINAINDYVGAVWDDTLKWHMIPCNGTDTLPIVRFIIGGHTYEFEGKDYVFPWSFYPGKIDCVTVFAPQASENSEDPAGLHYPPPNTWIFGVPFMGRYYTELDFFAKRVGFAQSKQEF